MDPNNYYSGSGFYNQTYHQGTTYYNAPVEAYPQYEHQLYHQYQNYSGFEGNVGVSTNYFPDQVSATAFQPHSGMSLSAAQSFPPSQISYETSQLSAEAKPFVQGSAGTVPVVYQYQGYDDQSAGLEANGTGENIVVQSQTFQNSSKPGPKRYSSRGRRHRNYNTDLQANETPYGENTSWDKNSTTSTRQAKGHPFNSGRDSDRPIETVTGQESRYQNTGRPPSRGRYSSRSYKDSDSYTELGQNAVRGDFNEQRKADYRSNSRGGRRGNLSSRTRDWDHTDRRADYRERDSRDARQNTASRKGSNSARNPNLTDEEKEQLGMKTGSVGTVNFMSMVNKVDSVIGSQSGYRGSDIQQQTERETRESGRDRPQTLGQKPLGQKPPAKKKQTQAGRTDETQRESYVDQLRQGTYECMVCCCNIRCEVAVWSCTNCYHIFHLYCIKKWARSPAAAIEGGEGWRCPGCQNVTARVPNQYKCFCGKRLDPVYDRFETPHSCGEVCGRQRNTNCPHSCNILCHPGACPPCEATVNKSCECGKTKKFVKCAHSASFQCDTVCERTLNCGLHQCHMICHSGPCGDCEKTFTQACFGEHTERVVTCGTANALLSSYSCQRPCDRLLSCGQHRCDRACHDGPCPACALQPDQVTHCPCGQTELSALADTPRQSCLDPVPLCTNTCGKSLKCGPEDSPHTCERPCHSGPCGPCEGSSLRRCRCGHLEKDMPCEEASQYTEASPLLCERRCSKKRRCGRHKCNQPCCVMEEHICELVCGRKLSCGLHKCEHLCHRGNCSPCLQASFDELTCHCGSAVLYPPVPCGTRPPECGQMCTRNHACHHPVTHRCHSDEECPPCTMLTEKKCMGGHEVRKNIPCHRQDISCGLACKKPLSCGQHVCQKTCHKDVCLESDEMCSQLCAKPRGECGHPCAAPCHSGAPCPKTQCKTKVTIRCKCGKRSAQVACSSGGLNDIADFQRMATANLASSLSSLQTGQSVDISELAAARKSGNKQLECDKECALLERNRRVALALEIRNPDLSAKLGSPPYSQFLKDFAKQNPQVVSGVEKGLSDLVQSAKQSKQAFRRHAFPPMNMNQRRMIHELAEFYGCTTESYDQEPKKNVVATANRDRCWLPSVTLTSLVQRELQPKAPLPIPHRHSEKDLRDAVREINLSTDVYVAAPKKADKMPGRKSPVVDYFDMTD